MLSEHSNDIQNVDILIYIRQVALTTEILTCLQSTRSHVAHCWKCLQAFLSTAVVNCFCTEIVKLPWVN